MEAALAPDARDTQQRDKHITWPTLQPPLPHLNLRERSHYRLTAHVF